MIEYKIEYFSGEGLVCSEYRSFQCYALAADYVRMQIGKPVVGGGEITSALLYSGDDWEHKELFC